MESEMNLDEYVNFIQIFPKSLNLELLISKIKNRDSSEYLITEGENVNIEKIYKVDGVKIIVEKINSTDSIRFYRFSKGCVLFDLDDFQIYDNLIYIPSINLRLFLTNSELDLIEEFTNDYFKDSVSNINRRQMVYTYESSVSI